MVFIKVFREYMYVNNIFFGVKVWLNFKDIYNRGIDF